MRQENYLTKIGELEHRITEITNKSLGGNVESTIPLIGTNSEIEIQLRNARKNIALIQEELKLERERIETYKEIAKNSEVELSRVNHLFDSYKTEFDIKWNDSIENVKNLVDRLGLFETENVRLQEESTLSKDGWEETKNNLENELSKLKTFVDLAESRETNVKII